MTERERWIVYPLLFLALGAALRDKLVDRTVTKRIVCQELSIEDDDSDGQYPPRVYARIGRSEATDKSPAFGYLSVNGLVEVHGITNISGAMNVDGVINARQILPIAPRTQWS